MRMSNKSYNNMNTLAAMCFDANAVFDNLAYCLDYHYYNNAAKTVHLKVAHVMPEWADLITDKMLHLSARPVRLAIGSYSEDYEELKGMFEVMVRTLEKIRTFTIEMIESADMAGDDDVRIFGEEFLVIVLPYLKQAEEWLNAASRLDSTQLDLHFEKYTHFIKVDD